MQIKTRSTLPTGAFFMQVVVLLDLVVLVCVLTIMTSRVGMAYGYEVKAPSSRFLMNIVGDVEFISVTAGDQPAFYIGNRLIEGGLPGVSAELDRISRENEGDGGGRVGIALAAGFRRFSGSGTAVGGYGACQGNDVLYCRRACGLIFFHSAA